MREDLIEGDARPERKLDDPPPRAQPLTEAERTAIDAIVWDLAHAMLARRKQREGTPPTATESNIATSPFRRMVALAAKLAVVGGRECLDAWNASEERAEAMFQAERARAQGRLH